MRPEEHTEIMESEGIDPRYNSHKPTIMQENEDESEQTKDNRS
jgi:hypothetical protein